MHIWTQSLISLNCFKYLLHSWNTKFNFFMSVIYIIFENRSCGIQFFINLNSPKSSNFNTILHTP